MDVHVPLQMTTEFEVFLDSIGISYSLMIENLQYVLDQEKASNMQSASAGFDYKKYNRYNEVVAIHVQHSFTKI